MGKPTKSKAIKARKEKTPGRMPDFPPVRKVRALEKVVDKSNITEGTLKQHLGGVDRDGTPFEGKPLYQGYSAGVLLEQSFNLSSVNTALDSSPQERHIYIQHPTGRRELLSYTPGR